MFFKDGIEELETEMWLSCDARPACTNPGVDRQHCIPLMWQPTAVMPELWWETHENQRGFEVILDYLNLCPQNRQQR